jgi:CHAD domain-containing protein
MNIAKASTKSKAKLLTYTNPLERFQYVFSSHWEALCSWKKKVIINAELSDIHHLRTALRRFCLSLKLYEYFTSRKVKKSFKKSLKYLTSMLGKLRDIDEAVLYFQSHKNYSSRHQLYKNLAKMRSIYVESVKNLLNDFGGDFDNLILKMSTQLKSRSFTEESNLSLLTHVSNISTKLSHAIHASLDDILGDAKQRKSRHALRVAIRKWRYYLELFAIILNRDYDSLIKILRIYQTILGEINDIATFVKLCNAMALSPPVAKHIKKTLLLNEKHLLKKLAKLIKSKPL